MISPGLMSISSSSREGVAQLLELRAKAAVEHDVADRRDHAADQRGIDRDVELDAPAGARRERALEPRALRVVERRGRGDARLHEARRGVGELLELGADRVEVDQAALVDHVGEEVAHDRGEREPLAQRAQHRAALRHRVERPEQRVAQRGLGFEQRRDPRELAADLRDRARLVGEREQRARIAPGRGRAAHRLLPRLGARATRSMNSSISRSRSCAVTFSRRIPAASSTASCDGLLAQSRARAAQLVLDRGRRVGADPLGGRARVGEQARALGLGALAARSARISASSRSRSTSRRCHCA